MNRQHPIIKQVAYSPSWNWRTYALTIICIITLIGLRSPTLAATDNSRNGAACIPFKIVAPPLTGAYSGMGYEVKFTTQVAPGAAYFSMTPSVVAGGMKMMPNGTFTGTPKWAGTWNFFVTVTGPFGCPEQKLFTLVVKYNCLQLGLSTWPNSPAVTADGSEWFNLEQGKAFNMAFIVGGGSSQYTLSAVGMPAGTQFSSTGGFSGTPTTPGTYPMKVIYSDKVSGCVRFHWYNIFVYQKFGAMAQTTELMTGTTTANAYPADVSSGLQYYPLSVPIHLLDTRAGQSACDAPGTPINAGVRHRQNVVGRACDGQMIPATARALTGTITIIPATAGSLTLFAGDADKPEQPQVEFALPQLTATTFTVDLNVNDGAFDLETTANADVVLEVTGFYAQPSAGGLYYHELAHPVRMLDTKTGQDTCQTWGEPVTLEPKIALLTGTCGNVTIPANAQAIVGTVTTMNARGQGTLMMYPPGPTTPLAATSSFAAGQSVNTPFLFNLLGANNALIRSTVETDLIIEVTGYFSEDSEDANGIGQLYIPRGKQALETERGRDPQVPGKRIEASLPRTRQ